MKSKPLLLSFIAYCKAHPHERFWQALRNWSKYNFIFGSMVSPHLQDSEEKREEFIYQLEDTFYK